ncbi:MAG: hypothetical protein QM728_03495 [Gordonia sp. (in: high G+C Gram-positive bacteria)]|uniref:hypothetical protein n=1 Tax=Gordonia sp. (in: high G+C Gram-positive bacteria) TaxID=84139 RepID=UPI0039E33174
MSGAQPRRAVLLTRAAAAALALTAGITALQLAGDGSGGYRVVASSVDNKPAKPQQSKPGGPLKTPPLALPQGQAGSLPAPALAAPAPGAPAPGGAAGLTAPVPGGTGTTPGGPNALGSPTLTSPDGQDWRPSTSCPDWPAPLRTQQGGLSSLINLAPAAGPFMSEAFALGSVYQPMLSIAGPLLAEIEPVIAANLPWINPLIDQAQAVGAVVLEAILPYYGPYRQQVLTLEGGIARDLTPILQRLASTPQAVCFVAWQAKAIRDAKGGKLTVASLAHPGERIRLSPDGKGERVK